MEPVLEQMIRKYPEMDICLPDIRQAVELLHHTYANGGKVLVCGNGGSASDSEHIVGELMKGFMLQRPVNDSVRARLNEAFPGQGDYLADHLQGALPAISLVSQSALAMAFINDVEPDMVFAQQVFGYAKEGDAVIGLSTSGNSKNVLHALQVAKAMGARTIGLTGRSGGQMKDVCDTVIRVPYDSTPDIQERHLPVYHAICMMLEEAFFPS
ncbi:D-sedoheptulose-7-phosphate isomerase [Paenibacillus mendelii]|uniref:SIS domain-containing protein n=1 Tax=Paenibacillus mendelii TaxID=206163 RepID=A0ABV6JHD5_9BACL|nr:SIS domain-containing protein [Paenibacillus mendelii]MCQ6558201.1 SIS domain-containing protein [Paenibacillus mendelii]